MLCTSKNVIKNTQCCTSKLIFEYSIVKQFKNNENICNTNRLINRVIRVTLIGPGGGFKVCCWTSMLDCNSHQARKQRWHHSAIYCKSAVHWPRKLRVHTVNQLPGVVLSCFSFLLFNMWLSLIYLSFKTVHFGEKWNRLLSVFAITESATRHLSCPLPSLSTINLWKF